MLLTMLGLGRTSGVWGGQGGAIKRGVEVRAVIHAVPMMMTR